MSLKLFSEVVFDEASNLPILQPGADLVKLFLAVIYKKILRKYLTFFSKVYAHIVEKKFYDLGSSWKVGYKINIGRYKLFEMGRENEKEER
jgi:hypothetical protein